MSLGHLKSNRLQRTNWISPQRESNSTQRSIILSLSEGDDSENDTTLKQGRTKRRKIVDDVSVKQPQGKKVKGVRGALKNLVDLPLDLIFEIFAKLEPLDLWHLAQTTKEFRAMLMSRSNAFVWRNTFLNYPNVPELPADLNEPQYAVLLFGKHCYECLGNFTLSQMCTFWDGRVRLCSHCVTRVCTWHDYDIDMRFRQWMPKAVIYVAKRERTYHYTPLPKQWSVQYQNLTTESHRTAWLSELGEERKLIRQHSEECAAWFKSYQENLSLQKASLIDHRRGLVIEHAKRLGWAEEFIKSPESAYNLECSSRVKNACRKNLTERVLTNLNEHINGIMTEVQSKRIKKEQKLLLEERLPVFKEIFSDCVKTLPVNSLHPSAGQLLRLPVVRHLIMNTAENVAFTKEHLRPVVDTFPELVSEWQAASKQKLLKMIANAHGADNKIDATIFDLATTFFSCGRCSHNQVYNEVRYPRVLIHECLRSRFYTGAYDGRDIYDTMIARIIQEGDWNEDRDLSFNLDDVRSLGDVIELCGFDRHATTIVEMEDAAPVVECLSCHSEHNGRKVMSWSSAISHRNSKYGHGQAYRGGGGKKMILKLLDKQEAIFIREQLAVEQEKQRVGVDRKNGMVCTICCQVGCLLTLRKHFKQSHGNYPTRDDIIPLVDHDHTLPEYWMWPPREDEDLAVIKGTEIS